MKNLLPTNQNSGFTIIETMIATLLFLVVMTVGISALINVNAVGHKSEDQRAVLDNLSFVLEEMSRNLRTGSVYHCEENGNGLLNVDAPQDCSLGYLVAFEEARGDVDDPDDQWIYKIDTGSAGLNVMKSVDAGITWTELINSPDIEIDQASGFVVLGSVSPPEDTNQPFVIIKLAGKINGRNGVTDFSLQTAVSQRFIDL